VFLEGKQKERPGRCLLLFPKVCEQQTQVPGPSAPAVPENDYRDPSLDNPEEEQLVKLAQEGE